LARSSPSPAPAAVGSSPCRPPGLDVPWLCSYVYLMMIMSGSEGLRSTCLRAVQPFTLLHL
jgi:hypothetical protein